MKTKYQVTNTASGETASFSSLKQAKAWVAECRKAFGAWAKFKCEKITARKENRQTHSVARYVERI